VSFHFVLLKSLASSYSMQVNGEKGERRENVTFFVRWVFFKTLATVQAVKP
jgi:hypothetical protein